MTVTLFCPLKGGGEDRNGTAEILVKGMKAVGDGCGTHRGAGICIIGVPIVFLYEKISRLNSHEIDFFS